MCKVHTGYYDTSGIEHDLCACTVDNPRALEHNLCVCTVDSPLAKLGDYLSVRRTNQALSLTCGDEALIAV